MDLDLPAGLAGAQRRHWNDTFLNRPDLYGMTPSAPAVHATDVFRARAARTVLDLGAGHGRDTLWFARNGFGVIALDYSASALDRVRAHARATGLTAQISTARHDVHDPLPLPDRSVDAVFAHMLLCMTLSTATIHALVGEIGRVLNPGGTFVYTVRHTGDPHYGTGLFHGDNIYEHGGFAVHYFDRGLVEELGKGWIVHEVYPFEEGRLPQRLWRVTQSVA